MNDKRELLASLRRQLRALEAELGSVVDVETSTESTDPLTLTAREALLTDAERISHVGSWAWHVASNSVHWSDEMFRIFGVDPSNHGDLVEAFFSAIHPDQREAMWKTQAQLVESGSIPPTDVRLVRADGTERLVRLQSVAVLDATGALARFVGTAQDLTELREAERQKVRHDEMLRGAEALANVGSFRWVPSTAEIIWSPQFKVIIGVPPETVGSFEGFLSRVHLEDRQKLTDSTARALANGTTESMPLRLVRDDGQTRHLVLEGRFIAGGEMIGSVLDVTELRRLESDLFQAQKLEALGRLAGGIAHDFNNILAVLKLGTDSRKAGAALRTELSLAIDRGAALTRQLLAFSRKNLLEPRPIDVSELLRQSVTLVARLLGDAVTVRLATENDPLTVSADPTQLQHTLINLLVNARDAMPMGGAIWLTARARHFEVSPPGVNPTLVPGPYVEIEVRDQGTGIEAAVLPHIFEPFFTTKAVGRGTGLGLATVYGTVSQSGGGLGVQSREGAGTTFRIYLPRIDAQPASTVLAAEPASGRGKGERILVIDDLPAIRDVLAIILEGAGFAPLCVEDVKALVADAAHVAASCEAVLTDLDMPGFTGPEIAQILWRHAPELPVLFMSGHPVLKLPAPTTAETSFLAKPFSADEVVARLMALLGKENSLH